MNQSQLQSILNNEIENIEREIQSLTNESDRAYQNQEMFKRLYNKWYRIHNLTENRIKHLEIEKSQIKNPY